MRRPSLFRFVSLLLGASLLALPAAAQSLEEQVAELRQRLAQLEQQAEAPAGKLLYDAACATCHGYDGRGEGPQAQGFEQPATNFTTGIYKFRSSLSEYPAPGDLERSIREGMSGTEMVPFERLLTDDEIASVADYLKTFSEAFDEPDARPEPDAYLDMPSRPGEPTGQTVARGRELWSEFGCGDCHGENGAGTSEEIDDWGRPVKMIDFRLGYYKSGDDGSDLYRSIATGMYGTSMGAYGEDMSPEEIWALVDFIRSLEQEPGFFGALFSSRPSGFDYRNY